MTENRTLAEFGGTDADGDAQASDDVTDSSVESDDATDSSGPAETQSAEATDPEATSEASTTADSSTDSATTTDAEGTTEPATVTYAWSPEGDACDACDETVDRRWRAGEGAADPDSLVCDGCKEW